MSEPADTSQLSVAEAIERIERVTGGIFSEGTSKLIEATLARLLATERESWEREREGLRLEMDVRQGNMAAAVTRTLPLNKEFDTEDGRNLRDAWRGLAQCLEARRALAATGTPPAEHLNLDRDGQ